MTTDDPTPDDLGDRLRQQADISTRPGQHDELYELAEEVDQLTAEVKHLWALLTKRRAQQHEVDRLAAEVERLRESERQARSVIALHQQNGCGVQLMREGEQVKADVAPTGPAGCVDCDHVWLSHRFASHGGGCGVAGCVCTEPRPDQETRRER